MRVVPLRFDLPVTYTSFWILLVLLISYRLKFRNPPPDLMRVWGLVKYMKYRYLGISLYLTLVLLVTRVTICYHCYHHNFPYATLPYHIYLCYQYCSKVWTPPNWADLETIGWLFFRWVFLPFLQSWMFTFGVTSLQSYAPTSAIMPCITCKPIRPNISTSSR